MVSYRGYALLQDVSGGYWIFNFTHTGGLRYSAIHKKERTYYRKDGEQEIKLGNTPREAFINFVDDRYKEPKDRTLTPREG